MRYSRSFQATTLFLLLLAFGSFACRRQVAAAPIPGSTPAATAPVRTAAAAPAITLRVDRPAITRGQSATLSVATQNATSVTIEPGLGNVPVNGSRQVSPLSSVTFVATAIGPGGTTGDSVRVTVNEPPPPIVTPTRAVTPNTPSSPPLTMDQQIQKAMQTILFDYDKADVRADQTDKLRGAAAFLKQNPNLRFTIEGHCDERGSEEYNLALGDRRANAIKQYLIGQGIVARLAAVSYGEERPVCNEKTEECYERNRRAVFTRIY